MKRVTGILILTALLLALAAGCATADRQGDAASPAGTAAASMPSAGDSWSDDETAIAQFTGSLQSVAEQDFTLADLNGKQWKLSDLKGKVVLLNFWATWCGPCQMEMPGFQKLYERFGDGGEAIVITVASAALEGQKAEAAKASVTEFIQEQKFTFPVLFDADGAVWEIYQQEGIPANYIIDKQGNVRLLFSGAFRDEETMYAALEAVRRADSGK